MPQKNLYRTAVCDTISSWAVRPQDAPFPKSHNTLTIRSDRPDATDIGLSLADIYKNMTSSGRIEVTLHPGPTRLRAPGRNAMHLLIAAGTTAVVETDTSGGVPSATTRFTPPLHVDNPVPGVLGKLSPMQYELESVYLNKDGSIEVEGELHALKGCYHTHDRRYAVKPPVQPDLKNHSLVKLTLATGVAVLRNIPTQALKAVGHGLHLHMKKQAQADYVELLEDMIAMVQCGFLSSQGVLAVNKPSVVHADGVDLVLAAQSVHFDVKAKIAASPTGIALEIQPGSAVKSHSLSFDLDGCLFADGKSIRGENCRLAVSKTRLDAYVNNGTVGQMLLPLSIQSGKADVHGDFVYDNKMLAFSGAAEFCLPTRTHDTKREITLPQGRMVLEQTDMELLLRGSAVINQPTLATSNSKQDAVQSKQIDLTLDVHTLGVTGRIDAATQTPESAMSVSLPLRIGGQGLRQKPLTLQAVYNCCGHAESAMGARALFVLPVQATGELSVHVQSGHAKLEHAELLMAGDINFGSKVADPDVDLTAFVEARITQVDGQIHIKRTQVCEGVELHTPTDLRLRGSHPARPKPQAGFRFDARRHKKDAAVTGEGVGGLNIPVELMRTQGDTPICPELHFQPGARVRMQHAAAQLELDYFTFAYGANGISYSLAPTPQPSLKQSPEEDEEEYFSADEELGVSTNR